MADAEHAATGGSSSTALKAAVAAAATGAAVYAVRRVRADHDAEEEADSKKSGGADGDRDSGSKREELTQALSSKVGDAKKAAQRLKPGKSNVLETAWDSASGHVLPVANDLASSLGAAVAKKAPDVVRDELMPHFIDGFEKKS